MFKSLSSRPVAVAEHVRDVQVELGRLAVHRGRQAKNPGPFPPATYGVTRADLDVLLVSLNSRLESNREEADRLLLLYYF